MTTQAQTTGDVIFTDIKIEFKIGTGGAWTDYSGESNTVNPGKGGARDAGDFYTFSGDKGLTKVGKRKTEDITFHIAYIESDAGLYNVLHDAYLNKTTVQARWSPTGTTGEKQFTTDAGYIKECPPPSAAAEKAEIVAIDVLLHTPGVERATI